MVCTVLLEKACHTDQYVVDERTSRRKKHSFLWNFGGLSIVIVHGDRFQTFTVDFLSNRRYFKEKISECLLYCTSRSLHRHCKEIHTRRKQGQILLQCTFCWKKLCHFTKAPLKIMCFCARHFMVPVVILLISFPIQSKSILPGHDGQRHDLVSHHVRLEMRQELTLNCETFQADISKHGINTMKNKNHIVNASLWSLFNGGSLSKNLAMPSKSPSSAPLIPTNQPSIATEMTTVFISKSPSFLATMSPSTRTSSLPSSVTKSPSTLPSSGAVSRSQSSSPTTNDLLLETRGGSNAISIIAGTTFAILLFALFGIFFTRSGRFDYQHDLASASA